MASLPSDWERCHDFYIRLSVGFYFRMPRNYLRNVTSLENSGQCTVSHRKSKKKGDISKHEAERILISTRTLSRRMQSENTSKSALGPLGIFYLNLVYIFIHIVFWLIIFPIKHLLNFVVASLVVDNEKLCKLFISNVSTRSSL